MLSIQVVRCLSRLRHLALFFALSPLFSHTCSFLALTVTNSSLFTPALLRTHSFVFFNPQNLSQSFHLKGTKTCFFILSECPAMQPYVATLIEISSKFVSEYVKFSDNLGLNLHYHYIVQGCRFFYYPTCIFVSVHFILVNLFGLYLVK